MCDFLSGYRFPDGSLHFHTDEEVEAAWERKHGGNVAISWYNMVGHDGYKFACGEPPAGAVEIEGLHYALALHLHRFRNLMRGAGYKSITVRDPHSVAEGRTLYAKSERLRAEGDKLLIEANARYATLTERLLDESEKPHAKGDTPYAECSKLYAGIDKLYDESARLHYMAEKLCFDVVKYD